MAWSPDLKKIKFVPFAMKNRKLATRTQEEAFTNMLIYNSKEIAKKTTFQVLGVHADDMHHLQGPILEACPAISHIDATALTAKQGRWRIYCDKTCAKEVEKWLTN
eukprot:scaffold9573_cov86-Cylindrotheca_fusiformis.AAC.1